MDIKQFKPYLGVALILSVAAIFIFKIGTMPISEMKPVLKEDGPIESITVYPYIVSILLVLYIMYKYSWNYGYLAVILLGSFIAREFDVHSMAKVLSYTSTKFYFSPKIPLWEKIAAISVISGILTTLFFFVKLHYKQFFKALREKKAFAISLLPAFLFLPGSQFIDKSDDLFLDYLNIAFDQGFKYFLKATEEICEFCIPILFILGAAQYIFHKRSFADKR